MAELSPQALLAKNVKDACNELEQVFLQKPAVRLVLWNLARQHGTSLKPPMKVYKYRSKLTGIPDRFEELFAIGSWEASVNECVDGIWECGKAVTELTCSLNATSSDDWLYAAKFLGVGNPHFWPLIPPESSSARALEQLADPIDNIRVIVKYFIKKLFWEDDSVFNSKPMLLDHLRDAAQQIDWNRECASLRKELSGTLSALRLAATTRAVTLRGGAEPWYAVALFLLIMPTTGNDRSTAVFTDFRIDGLAREWLSKIPITRAPRLKESESKTGQDPFDPRNACDFQNRVFTPNSGHSRKPGAHKDNRGHR